MAKHVEAINVSSSAAVSQPSFNATQDCAGGCGGTYAGIVCDNECYGDASILNCNAYCDNYSAAPWCNPWCDLQIGASCTVTCYYYNNLSEGCSRLVPYGPW